MLTPSETPYTQPLGNGLILRTAGGAEDVERVAVFNGIIHGPEIVPMTRNLLYRHPAVSGRDLVFVEDETGQVVSSLVLIPWTWRFEGVDIPSGEMGIVGTLEAYRRRGLIRAQVDYFFRRLRERGCLLSQIQGIPYYYRQFGYEYALPLEGGTRIETRQIPEPSQQAFTFRLATPEDVPTLMRLYEEAAVDLGLHAARDEAVWRYLLSPANEPDAMSHETWIVQGAEGNAAGYVRLPAYHFGEELAVDETSRLGFEAALATLQHVRQLTLERGRPGIRLNLPVSCPLVQLARALGAHDMGTYAWQIHIPNPTALLQALAPVIECRVARSPLAGLTREVRIGLYRETVRLRFVEGKLAEVANLGFTGDEAVSIPPLPFVPLALGHRSIEELHTIYPDVRVWGVSRFITGLLFPKVSAFLYTNY